MDILQTKLKKNTDKLNNITKTLIVEVREFKKASDKELNAVMQL